jgi:uncharacterized protein (TIGR03089 family)
LSITEALLGPLRAVAPARPLITHYDDAAGTRVELSVATLANWAAKTANWLTAEHDLEPGDPVVVRLPAHWQTAGILLGAWWCGAAVTDKPDDARVVFAPPGVAVSGAETVAVVSLDPMGRDLGSPDGVVDFIAESRLHGDDFVALTQVPGNTPALLESTVDDLLATARERAAALEISPGTRVLSTVDWTFPEGVTDSLLAVLAGGGSLVQVTNPDLAKLPGHRAAERTTVELTRPSVLFLCVHNAGRSQMALGWLTHLAGDRVAAYSGGSAPAATVNPAAVAAMAERGIDISAQTPRRWTDDLVRAADVVITMGCGDTCPVFPGRRYEEWVLDDPAGLDVAAVRPIRDEIERRVRDLLVDLDVPIR